MLPEYDWSDVGETSAWMQVHKNNGNLYWNTRTHQLMGFPQAVCLCYDEGTNSLGIQQGLDFTVLTDDEGLYHIDASDAMQECGLSFPLADHISGEPIHQQDSRNLIVFDLGG